MNAKRANAVRQYGIVNNLSVKNRSSFAEKTPTEEKTNFFSVGFLMSKNLYGTLPFCETAFLRRASDTENGHDRILVSADVMILYRAVAEDHSRIMIDDKLG